MEPRRTLFFVFFCLLDSPLLLYALVLRAINLSSTDKTKQNHILCHEQTHFFFAHIPTMNLVVRAIGSKKPKKGDWKKRTTCGSEIM